jgi:hypothetical protein
MIIENVEGYVIHLHHLELLDSKRIKKTISKGKIFIN